jgi:Domain of unknown function (DUF4832)/Domain of unknown function (DUF4874)
MTPYKNLFMKLTALTICLTALLCCKKNNAGGQNTNPQTTTVNYTASAADFANPERGFYRYSATNAGNYAPLNVNELKGYRNEHSISNGNYKITSTLVFRYYVLEGFNNQPLSAALLGDIQGDFDAARQAGIKLIPRFVYTTTAKAGTCPEGFICPPYGDAPKSVILNHIEQLKPLLVQNADMIACLQMGFIGTWGENYYTDYFGDPSSNQSVQKLLDNNWQDRFDILQAVLNALPKDRMVQVRYPQFKQRFVYGVNAGLSSAALTAAEAFTETDKARIAFHNDCFLSGPNDIGTYEDYGNSSTNRSSDDNVVTALRNYKKQDSKYVAIGGETCMDSYSPQNDCENAGKAQTEMAAMHYSFLNANYNNEVNNDWQTGGCMENIKKNLGYRFVLKNATFPTKAKKGATIKVNINLDNVGYASPFNPRPVQLVLRNSSNGTVKIIAFDTDIRQWFSGSIALEQEFTLPADITAGEYDLLLNLPDKYASISSRSEYAIRLANTYVWEEATGYNKLNYKLVVE